MVAAVFPACARSDAVALAEAFMVSVSHIAVFSEMPESAHTNYSVSNQRMYGKNVIIQHGYAIQTTVTWRFLPPVSAALHFYGTSAVK